MLAFYGKKKHKAGHWNASNGQGHMDPEPWILGVQQELAKQLKLHGQTMVLTKNAMSSTSAVSRIISLNCS